MNDSTDLLKIKIEKAKSELPESTRQAIETVDWRESILGLRESKGYSFEQLADLEIETELLLCGLLDPKDYPGEIEARLKIPKARVDELVNDMNKLVFGKIREELVRSSERNKIFASHTQPTATAVPPTRPTPPPPLPPQIKKDEASVLDQAGIKIIDSGLASAPLNKIEKIEPKVNEVQVLENAGIKIENVSLNTLELGAGEKNVAETHPILSEKLGGAFKVASTNTEHSFKNISKEEDKTPPKVTPPTSYPGGGDPYRVKPE